jgi:hypothetical protein
VPVLPKPREVNKAIDLSEKEIKELNAGVVRGDENPKQTVEAKRAVKKGRKGRTARKSGGTRKLRRVRKQFKPK